jgi:HEAT repeat protein
LIEKLNDKNILVVDECVRTLGKLKDKRAVKPLEKALEKAQDLGLKDDIACALKQITGKNYGRYRPY